MTWAKPAYSRGQVDKAGDALATGETDAPSREFALAVLSNWRAAHAYPLQALKMTLLARARRVDPLAVVAQRLKRRTSVTLKLRRYPGMKLSRMQDVGGCRAILRDIARLDALIRVYENQSKRLKRVGGEYVSCSDYIGEPKIDGYRGRHYVYKYASTGLRFEPWNGLRIELQLRTRLQHAWATAVETVDTFMGQGMKTGGGDELWRRFFLLMSTAIARLEGTSDCRGCPAGNELTEEIQDISDRLGVESKLNNWSAAMRSMLPSDVVTGGVYLLSLDSSRDVLSIRWFPDREAAAATDFYSRAEQEADDRSSTQAVLVSVEAVQALRTAFPNYFADSALFVGTLRDVLARTQGRV